jgi:hypothetical protein
MIEKGSSDRSGARTYAYQNAEKLDALIQVLVDSTIDYLAMQAAAGAQALKLFESWAEGLSEPLFDRLVTQPHIKIIEGLRARGVTAPILGFPRGAGTLVEDYAAKVPVQGVALDTSASAKLGPVDPEDQDHPGRAGPAAAAGRRRCAVEARRRAARTVEPGSLHLQPGPRHFARYADRPCRGGAGTGDRPEGRPVTSSPSRKLAVVLFNLGGPDGPRAVRPFLFNLFRDAAIIGLPAIARYPIAALIATTREKTAKANYAIMGGGSPLLPETEKQARALEAELAAACPASRPSASSPCATGTR